MTLFRFTGLVSGSFELSAMEAGVIVGSAPLPGDDQVPGAEAVVSKPQKVPPTVADPTGSFSGGWRAPRHRSDFNWFIATCFTDPILSHL